MARPAPRRAPLPLVLLATLLLAGCSGQPAAPASPFPPRPEPIDVSRLDPCSGVPPSEIERLGIDSVSPGRATVDGTSSPSCLWESYDARSPGYSAQIIPLGAAGAATEPGSRVVDIDGYGAVQSAPGTNNGLGRPAFCQIAIDAADGQTIRIQVDNGDPTTGGDLAAVDAVCAETRRFASVYLSTIRR